nr:hypothetical protein [uncultured Acetatifactor sp.]
MIRQVKRMALLLLGSAILGTLLLVLAFCLPTGRMKENVAVSVDSMIKDEGEVADNPFARYVWGQKETYTDAIMVQNAIERISGKNVFEQAMRVYHTDLEEEIWTPEASLKAYCSEEGMTQSYLHEYSRYWHGYLIYLKPLLLIFSWSQIVVLGIVLQALLMGAVIFFSIKKGYPGVGAATALGFLFMKPVLVLVSLTMSVCFLITMAALLMMLLRHDKIEEKQAYPEVFLLIGIVTSYFDFLTYPAVTLGFPLCAYFLMKKEENIKKSLQKVIGYSVCWGIGYAGMWAMKWIIADLTLHTGTIKDAVWSIIGRTEAIGGRPRMNGGWYVIGLNLQEYAGMLYPVGAGLLTLGAALLVLRAALRRGQGKQVLLGLIPFAVIFCIPFAWIIVIQHHSALHARFTFRIISVAVTAVCCMGLDAWQRSRVKYGKN